MKPIQTRYAGCHFRSRLEARWAVFLDHLKIEWQYEPQGFDLGWNGQYLPDFRIDMPAGEGWLEIKPLGHGVHPVNAIDPRSLNKLEAFSQRAHLAVVGEFGRHDSDSVLVWQYRNQEWTPGQWQLGRSGRDVKVAWRRARSARFEFGQSGADVEPPSRAICRVPSLHQMPGTCDCTDDPFVWRRVDGQSGADVEPELRCAINPAKDSHPGGAWKCMTCGEHVRSRKGCM